MKNFKLSRLLTALSAAAVFALSPITSMAITDAKTAPTGVAPPAANGSNGMNTGGAVQSKPATIEPDSNINSKKQMEKDKNTPPFNPGGTNK